MSKDLIKKWSPLGVTDSKSDWFSQYSEMGITHSLEFPSILPMAMRVASKTIGMDLVSVQPLAGTGMSQEEIDRINNEVKKENRDGKIDALIDGKDFKEIKPEEHPDWKPRPVVSLMYMDFKYGEKNEEDDDESAIKGRKGTRKKKN